ncbi:MAG: hypothetical protein K0M45_07465 [Candidatus Paracaedibacteraceae bacterium]|nr:hypothetical protein [Candidatus Paracaedibacteraceae bacterium]
MAVFRKIVSSLVLVSYTKLILASSFAVDADFQRATNALKITLEPTRGLNGQLQSMQLRLNQQDRSTGSKVESLIAEAHIDVAEGMVTDNIKVIQDKGACWFEWAIPHLGTIQIDLNGTMLLQGVTHQSPTSLLKIKTSPLIILRNCAIHNLHLTSHTALLEGNNRLTSYKANHTFGITAFSGGQEQLKNLHLKQGRFLNATTLSLQGGGSWELGSNSFVNQGTLIIGDQGHTLSKASLVSNLGCIQGGPLQVAAQNYLNSGSIDLTDLRIQVRENMINQGQIHTTEEGIYRFGSQLINIGEITSDKTYLFASTAGQGTLTNRGMLRAGRGEFKSLKLINNHQIEHQSTLLQDVHLINTQTLNLGEIQPTSTLLTLLNLGSLTGSGPLTLREGENFGQLNVTDLVLTPNHDSLGRPQPFKNSGRLRGQTLTLLGQALDNQGQCELEALTLSNGAKLTNQAGGELDIDLLSLRGGSLQNEGLTRVQTLEGESLEETSSIENSGRFELSHTLQGSYRDLDGRILALILNNTGQFIAHNKLVYDYFRVYRGPYLSPSLNRGLNVVYNQGYHPSNPQQKWFIEGRVSAPFMSIKHLPLSDEFLRTLSQSHVIDEGTTWDTWMDGRLYHSIISQSHDLSNLGHLFLQGWNPSATLSFDNTIVTKGLTLNNFEHIVIGKSLHVTEGNLKVEETGTLTVGLSNTLMGAIRANRGEIDVRVKSLIHAKYGSLYAHGKLSLDAKRGTIHLGDRIIVPANEVAQRVSSKADDFLGKGAFGTTVKYTDFYLPNGASVESQSSQVVLKARRSIESQFASILAGGGLWVKTGKLDLLNTNLVLGGDSTIQANTFRYHRTPNVNVQLGEGGYIHCVWNVNCVVQTSHVARLFLLGNLNLLAPQFEVAGNDMLISGDIIRYGQVLDNPSEFIHIKSYRHLRECDIGDIIAPILYISPQSRPRYFSHHVDCVGTSGGNLINGQNLSLTPANELSVEGSSVSAQHIRADLSSVHLQTLREDIQRVPSQLSRLDTEAERIARGTPLITHTAERQLFLGRNGETGLVHRLTILPFLDPVHGVLTLNPPQDAVFRMDPTLEVLALMHYAYRVTGRIYDSLGNSGVKAYHRAIETGQLLATLGVPVNSKLLTSLSSLKTFLLFYQMVNENGRSYLVPQVYVPQTLTEDRVDRSGAMRAMTNRTTADRSTSIGGTVVATGEGDSLALIFGRQETRSAQLPGGGTVRSTEINERGNTHKAIHTTATLTDHDSRAKGTNTLRTDADITLTNSTMHGEERTAVQVDGLLTAASSSITAGKGSTVVKAKALDAQTLIETIYTDAGYYQRAQRQTAFGSTSGQLFMDIGTDALANGVKFYGTAIDIHTGGSRQFGAIPMSAYSQTRWKKRTIIEESCSHLRTTATVTTLTNQQTAQALVNLEVPLICLGREATDPVTFYEVPVPGANNDCGFNCLSIPRQEAVEMLLACQDDDNARAMVAPEIAEAFYKGDLEGNPAFTQRSDFQRLKAQQHLREHLNELATSQLNEALGLKRDVTWRETYHHLQSHTLQAQYPEFMQLAHRYLSFDEDLQTFAHHPEVYALYIQTYAPQADPADNKMLENLQDQENEGHHHISSSVFDLLARLLNKKLRVVSKLDNGQFKLMHEDDFEGEPLTVLHTLAGLRGGKAFDVKAVNGSLNHYNLLLTEDHYKDLLATLPAPSSLQDGEISVYSEGDALDIGMLTTGANKVFLGASGAYKQEPVYDWYQRQEIKKKRFFNKLSGFGKTKRVQSKQGSQLARPCTTISTNKKEIHLYGGKGTSLRGSVLKGGKLTIEVKEGLIHLLTTMGMTFTEVKKSSKDPLWQSKSQSFAYHENRQQCQFFYDEAQGGIEFKTPEGIVVELVTEKHSHADGKKNKGRPQEWQRLKDFSQTPGYEWMKLLDQRDDVVRIYVDENHHTSRSAQQGMTAAAKIVVTLVVMMCTGGTGGMFAALGKATAVTIGGATGAIVGGVINTTLTTLARSMIVNTIENRGRVDRAADATFNKESLKSLGAKLIGQVLIGGGPTPEANAADLAQTAQEVAQETATSWVTDLQDAFTDSLRANMANFVGQGIVYGNWREQLKDAGINTLTDTAAQFGATQLGAGRKEEIEQDLKFDSTDMFNYLSHKISHAALGAATRAANAKLSGGNSKEVKKAAKGGAVGAASAEMVAEFLMKPALERIKTTLQEEGLTYGTAAYTKGYNKLFQQELEAIKSYGEMAAVITAQACGGDLEAAQLAARNALTYNFSQMMVGIKRWEKNDMTPEELEEAKKQFREMLKRLIQDSTDHPDRIQDTNYETTRQYMLETVRGWYEGRERLFNGEINDATIGRTIAALSLDGVTTTCEALNLLSGGLLGLAGKGINTGLNVLVNTVGYTAGVLKDDPRFGQNVSDWLKVGGEIVPFVQPVKAVQRARQLQALDLAGIEMASTVARPRINKPLKEMSNTELVQAIANRAEYEIGGIGAVPGTHKHKYAENLLDRTQKMFGKRELQVEQRWVNNKTWEPNDPLKGSVKLDVYDINAKVVYDYKFVQQPGMGLKQKQVDRIQQQVGRDVSVIEVNPTIRK